MMRARKLEGHHSSRLNKAAPSWRWLLAVWVRLHPGVACQDRLGSLDPVKDVIQYFFAHIKHRTVFWNGLLGHPLGQAIILFGESSPAVEFAFHFDRLFAQGL